MLKRVAHATPAESALTPPSIQQEKLLRPPTRAPRKALGLILTILLVWFVLNERYKIKLKVEQEYGRGGSGGGGMFERVVTRLTHKLWYRSPDAKVLHLDQGDGCKRTMRVGSVYDGGEEALATSNTLATSNALATRCGAAVCHTHL